MAYMPGFYCDAAATGDVYFMGQSPEGRMGIYHYSPVSRKLRAVILGGQKLGDGATLVQPYQVSVGPSGSFFFAAHVYANGVNSMAVYEAVPLP